jgi:sugar lactone lactonase YvrE
MRRLSQGGAMNKRKIGSACIALAVAAFAAANAAASESASTSGPYKVVGTFGKVGTGNGQFSSNTHGIAVDKDGNVYVADTDNHRVQVFSAGGAFQRKFGSLGEGNGQFNVAEDVDVAANGTIAVADQQNGRIQLFSNGGGFKAAISTPDELPRGVAIADDGTVYGAMEGSARGGVRSWANPSAAASGLLGGGDYRPDDVELSPDGTIWFLANATQGSASTARHITASGAALGAFPALGSTALAVDADCNVWISNRNAGRVEKRSSSGRLLATASSSGLVANDIGASPKGDVYAIQQNGGVVHWALDKSKPATAGVPAKVTVKGGKATIPYAASFSCPDKARAVATLSGGGVSGRASVQVAAGKVTPIAMTVRAPAGKASKATFKIVVKTNGGATTETKSVTVVVK